MKWPQKNKTSRRRSQRANFQCDRAIRLTIRRVWDSRQLYVIFSLIISGQRASRRPSLHRLARASTLIHRVASSCVVWKCRRVAEQCCLSTINSERRDPSTYNVHHRPDVLGRLLGELHTAMWGSSLSDHAPLFYPTKQPRLNSRGWHPN